MPAVMPVTEWLDNRNPPAEAALFLKLRKALGWSRPKLARRLGVDQGTLGRWERGDIPEGRGTHLAALELLERIVADEASAAAKRPRRKA